MKRFTFTPRDGRPRARWRVGVNRSILPGACFALVLLATPNATSCHNPSWNGDGLVLLNDGPAYLHLDLGWICGGAAWVSFSYVQAGLAVSEARWVAASVAPVTGEPCVDPCGYQGGIATFHLRDPEIGLDLDGQVATHAALRVDSQWSVRGTIHGHDAGAAYGTFQVNWVVGPALLEILRLA